MAQLEVSSQKIQKIFTTFELNLLKILNSCYSGLSGMNEAASPRRYEWKFIHIM